jgi:elongation factor Ts
MSTPISSELVKQLRAMTGAGMMDCKKALEEAGGTIDQAIEVLRKKGLKNIDKRAGKVAAEGTIGMYIHAGGQVCSVVELNCETDFVAKTDEFVDLAKDVAMHVAAMKPRFLNIEEVPQAEIEKEKEILMAQLNDQQKTKADKILPGKIEKYYEEHVLLRQLYVKDEAGTKTIQDLIQEFSIKCGEKVVIRRFVRFEVGEGIEKSAGDFAADVAAMVQPTIN